VLVHPLLVVTLLLFLILLAGRGSQGNIFDQR
jgi:hypothetical protein